MRQATEATADQKGFPERACATVTFQGMSHKLLRHQKLLRHDKNDLFRTKFGRSTDFKRSRI